MHNDDGQGPGEVQSRTPESNGDVDNGGGYGGCCAGNEGGGILLERSRDRIQSQLQHMPLYIGNTATHYVIGNRTYSARAKHAALRFFYIRDLAKEGNIFIHCIHYVPTEQQLANIGTKHLKKQRHRFITNLIKNFGV